MHECAGVSILFASLNPYLRSSMQRLLRLPAALLGLCILTSPLLAQSPASSFSDPVMDIGVVVTDLKASMAFYTNVIGMTNTGSFGLDEDLSRRTGLSGGTPFHVEVMQLENREGSTQWKLISFGKDNTTHRNTHIQEQTGMQYITLFYDDLAPVLGRVRAHEIPMLGDTPTTIPDGRSFILIQDPDGIFIELIGTLSE